MPEQRLAFSKTGPARYISHLDLMRTFQRAFLRAGLHVRHTEGFNPHAFVSIPLPLSVGFSSACEILDFGLPQGVSPRDVPALLNAALPAGVRVFDCYDARMPYKKLAYVRWRVTMEYDRGVPAGAAQAFASLLEREHVVVRKRSKKAKGGFTEVDVIPMIRGAELAQAEGTLTAQLLLRAQTPGLNPELVVRAFREAFSEFAPDFASYHRLAVLTEELGPFS